MASFFKVPNSVYLNKSLLLLSVNEISQMAEKIDLKKESLSIEEMLPFLS